MTSGVAGGDGPMSGGETEKTGAGAAVGSDEEDGGIADI